MPELLTIQTPETVLFWFLAPLAVLAAIGMLLVKKAVHSALLLAWVMITLAIFYIAEGALFLGIVQVVDLVNLAVPFSRINGTLDGQVIAFFTMVVAACEVVVGLAIIVTIYRSRRSASIDDASLLKR